MYSKAVSRALANGYLYEEFLVRIRRSMFFLETCRFGRGIKELRKTYHVVQQWGAEGILEQLNETYFQYISHKDTSMKPALRETVTTRVDFMDTQAMIRAFQTLSAEIRLEGLLEKMTEIIIKNAGATRGVFLEYHNGNYTIQSGYENQKVSCILSNKPLDTIKDFPKSVVNYVVQSQKPVVLESLLEDKRFSKEVLLNDGTDRSVLCVPVIQKGSFFAVIYLENNLIKGVFTRNHLEVIKILSGQVAISLENAKLYDTLEQKVRERTRDLAEGNQKLQHLASFDKLTGIANRRVFDDVFDTEWRRLEREQGHLSLILCDIDYFKIYNDFYGHLKGDKCLTEVAEAIQNSVKRPGDLVARYGGEEFGIILPRTESDGAVKIAERIRRDVQSLKILHKESLVDDYLTVSLGVASMIPEKHYGYEELIKRADQSLYLAKKRGRNQVCSASVGKER